MWPFKHKHKYDHGRSKLACSLITGASVQVSYQQWCKCGYQIKKELSPAGYQQLSWGADEESLYDDGPIRPRLDKEEEVKLAQKEYTKNMGYHLSSI